MLPAELTAIVYGDVGRVEAGKMRKLYEMPESMLANLDAKLISEESDWGFKMKNFLEYRMGAIESPQQDANWHTGKEYPSKTPKVTAKFITNYPPGDGPTHDVGLMSVAYLSLLGDKSDTRFDEIAFLRAIIFLMCMSGDFFRRVQTYHILNLQRSKEGKTNFKENYKGESINFARLEVVASMINGFSVTERGERVPYQEKGSWVNDFYEYVKTKRPTELENFVS